jgi:hypothetical protein
MSGVTQGLVEDADKYSIDIDKIISISIAHLATFPDTILTSSNIHSHLRTVYIHRYINIIGYADKLGISKKL